MSGYDKYLNIKTRFGKRLRVICVPKNLVENTINHSGDGLESRLIAKDILYKIKLWLPEREYKLLSLYYMENQTMKEISKELGVTEARISQIHSKMIPKLKSRYG